MNKIINKSQAICAVVLIVILSVIILRPLQFVTIKPVVRSSGQEFTRSEPIKGDFLAAQKFIAPYSHLNDIKIYFLNETAGGEFRFILFDADLNAVIDRNITVWSKEKIPGMYAVRLDLDVEAGNEYCYMIQGISGDFYVAYEEAETSSNDCNRELFYGGMEVKGRNIVTEYHYEIPLGKNKALLCYASVILSGLVIILFTKKYYEKYPNRNSLLTVEKVIKCVATPIVIAVAVILLFAVWPGYVFSAGKNTDVIYNALDIIFAYAGILIAAGILLYGINHKRYNKSNDMGFSVLRDRWTDYMQAAFLALAFQSAVHYMNALYENQHIIAYREMLIYFGLSIIATYKRKEIFNRINFIYLGVAAVAGYLYYYAQAILADTEDDMRILKLTVWAGIIAGIVIINTVFILVRRQIGKISKYGIIVALLFSLLIIFRNTRGWPIFLACVFVIYYLRIAAWDRKERLLRNICNGILLHFLIMTGYCLMHRPYLFYNQTRYPFIFHTVTVSAEYLSMVICAALVKLLQAYHEDRRLSHIWKELTVFGISTVYLFITLSRTGYLAIVLTMLIVLPIVSLCMRYKMKNFLLIVSMLAAAVILCFPAVFTMQRIIPSVVAEPETFEIEWFPDEIKYRRETDSRQYITIRRFMQLFENKVLGIPESDCIVPYEEKDLYSEVMMLVASTTLSGAEFSYKEEESIEEESIIEDKIGSYASGRLDIFKLYIEHLDMAGHDTMEVIMPDGTSEGGHAHNTYIQAAYDHGIPVGIVFILFIICTLVQSLVYYKKRNADRLCSLLPFALMTAFAAAGLTEWIFHPCNPVAFGMLLSLAPLLCDMYGGKRYKPDSIQ